MATTRDIVVVIGLTTKAAAADWLKKKECLETAVARSPSVTCVWGSSDVAHVVYLPLFGDLNKAGALVVNVVAVAKRNKDRKVTQARKSSKAMTASAGDVAVAIFDKRFG